MKINATIQGEQVSVEGICPVCQRPLDIASWERENEKVTNIYGKCEKHGPQLLERI